eukprot:4487719-Prymnesium_polylepis.1
MKTRERAPAPPPWGGAQGGGRFGGTSSPACGRGSRRSRRSPFQKPRPSIAAAAALPPPPTRHQTTVNPCVVP